MTSTLILLVSISAPPPSQLLPACRLFVDEDGENDHYGREAKSDKDSA